MYMHPDMGQLLVREKLDEAQSRILPARLLRAAALERQQGPRTDRVLSPGNGQQAPTPAAIDRPPAWRMRFRAVAVRPSVARGRDQACERGRQRDHAGR